MPSVSTPALAIDHDTPSQRIWRRLELLLIPTAAAAMLVFVFAGIDRSIWLDEANSVSIASGNLHSIVERLTNDNNFPVYYIVLHYWMRLFGDSELALRLLSAICYVATAVTIYFGGRQLFRGPRPALYAAFCYLISTQAVHHAQNVRMYALLGWLSAASTVLFCRIFFRGIPSRRSWAWYVAVNAIGALTHLWFAFVFLAQFAAVLSCCPKRLRAFLLAAAAASLPFFVLWSPVLWAQLHNGATRWMPPFEPIFALHVLLDFYGGPVGLLFYVLCGTLILYHSPQTRPSLHGGALARALIVCVGVSLFLPLIISIFKPIYWPGRYTIIGLAPLALLLGAALARSAARPALVVFCYGTMAVAAAAHIRARDVNSESGLPGLQSDRSAAQFLVRLARPGDVLIFTSLSRPALDYYLRQANAGSRFTEIGFPQENSVHLGWGSTSVDDRRRQVLKAEAEGDVSHAANSLTSSEARAWVLYGYDGAVSRILKDELDRRLTFQREIPLVGPYYLSLLEYAAK
jgi:mannosyltransferase